jgi:transcriptional regulator with XRE-family HTH domain
MRHFPNKIAEIISQSQLRLNAISKMSGVSHTYLTKLVQGQINRPGKDKLASILLALNFSIADINSVLARYDYRPLNELDIPGVLQNNRKRRIEGSTLSLYDDLHVKLLLSPMERLGGAKILVKNTPSVLFMPEALYIPRGGPRDINEEAGAFHVALSRALFKERKAIFHKSQDMGSRFETYICRECFKAYLRAHLQAPCPERMLVVEYIAEAAAAMLRAPQLHLLRIIERCTYFDYQIQGADRKSPKVFYFGRKAHTYDGQSAQLHLQGFTSDAPAIISLFMQETEYCRKASLKHLEADYPHRLVDYLVDLFHVQGLGQALERLITKKGTL